MIIPRSIIMIFHQYQGVASTRSKYILIVRNSTMMNKIPSGFSFLFVRMMNETTMIASGPNHPQISTDKNSSSKMFISILHHS